MVIGITMIKTVPGYEKVIYESLRETKGFKKIYHLFGEFDFLVVLEASDGESLNYILEHLQSSRYILNAWPLLISKDDDSIIRENASLPAMDTAFIRTSGVAAG